MRAEVTAFTNDPAPADNERSTTTTVRPFAANLALTLTDSVDPTRVYRAMTDTARVSNAGPDTAFDTKLAIDFPAGASITVPSNCSTAANRGTGGTTVACSLLDVPLAGEDITIGVTWSSTGSKSIAARVTAVTPDPVASNDTATITTQVNVL